MSDSNSTPSTAKNKAFKPRAGVVRKSKAERDAHAKQEAEKTAARVAAAAAAASKSAQSSRSNASKKKETFKDRKDGSQSVVGGVFGASTGTKFGRRKAIVDTGHSELLEGQEGIKPRDDAVLQGQDKDTRLLHPGSTGKTSVSTENRKLANVTQDGMMIASDDESDEGRRDIERIYISSDEDVDRTATEVSNENFRFKTPKQRLRHVAGLRPVRALKDEVHDEHDDEERTGKKVYKSARMAPDGSDEEDESEEVEADKDPAIDLLSTKHDMPSSPELSKRTKPSRKVAPKGKDSRLTRETIEERAERLRLREDIKKIRGVFIQAPQAIKDDEIEQDHVQQPGDELFLFQFPPLVPFLADERRMPTTGPSGKRVASDAVSHIKPDPDSVESTATSPTEPGTNSGAALPKTQMEGMLTASEPSRLPPGRVGKLRIHKSGKVTLDWGGIDMEVRYGTEVNFLQNAVLVETPRDVSEDDEKDSGPVAGMAHALGQVQRKMIVIPDWQKLYD